MRKSWPYLVAVGTLGALAGLAISGRPTPGDSFVIDPSATTTPGASSTTSVPATPVPATTVPSTTSTTAATPITTVPTTLPTTTLPSTTLPATTVPATTVPATTVPNGPRARAEVRLVIANGDGRFNLATANANRLRAAGYVQIDETDVSNFVDATIIYFRPGFDAEAVIVAADLGIPNAIRTPLPATPVTINDDLGDIIVVLGPDALR